jgi:hypothetical protein
VRKRQLEVHHQAVHGISFFGRRGETVERTPRAF